MGKQWGVIIIFSLSSFLAFIVADSISPFLFNQAMIWLLILFVVFSKQIVFTSNGLLRRRWFRSLLLFTFAFVLQAFILSSGGFRSPFLVLLHVFILVSSFLMGIQAALGFLGIGLITLFLHASNNSALNVLFYNETGDLIVFISSFLVLVPLIITTARRYFLKESLEVVLWKIIGREETEYRALLDELPEMIIITNNRLQITSVNKAGEQALDKSAKTLVGRDFFEVFSFNKPENSIRDDMVIQIEEAVNGGNPFELSNVALYADKMLIYRLSSIHIRPVADTNKTVERVLFMIRKHSS